MKNILALKADLGSEWKQIEKNENELKLINGPTIFESKFQHISKKLKTNWIIYERKIEYVLL